MIKRNIKTMLLRAFAEKDFPRLKTVIKSKHISELCKGSLNRFLSQFDTFEERCLAERFWHDNISNLVSTPRPFGNPVNGKEFWLSSFYINGRYFEGSDIEPFTVRSWEEIHNLGSYPEVEKVILHYNGLGESDIPDLVKFLSSDRFPHLKEIYLGHNLFQKKHNCFGENIKVYF